MCIFRSCLWRTIPPLAKYNNVLIYYIYYLLWGLEVGVGGPDSREEHGPRGSANCVGQARDGTRPNFHLAKAAYH